MSISSSSGLTSITGSVSVSSTTAIPQPSSSQTLVTVKSQASINGNKTLYTVTAGKTFYLMGLHVYATGAVTQCSLKDNAGNIIFYVVPVTLTCYTIASAVPIASFAAGDNVVWSDSAANNLVTLWGYEV